MGTWKHSGAILEWNKSPSWESLSDCIIFRKSALSLVKLIYSIIHSNSEWPVPLLEGGLAYTTISRIKRYTVSDNECVRPICRVAWSSIYIVITWISLLIFFVIAIFIAIGQKLQVCDEVLVYLSCGVFESIQILRAHYGSIHGERVYGTTHSKTCSASNALAVVKSLCEGIRYLCPLTVMHPSEVAPCLNNGRCLTIYYSCKRTLN